MYMVLYVAQLVLLYFCFKLKVFGNHTNGLTKKDSRKQLNANFRKDDKVQ